MDWVWWIVTGVFVIVIAVGWVVISRFMTLSGRASEAEDPEVERALRETQAQIDDGRFRGGLGGG